MTNSGAIFVAISFILLGVLSGYTPFGTQGFQEDMVDILPFHGSMRTTDGTEYWAVTIVTNVIFQDKPYVYDALKDASNWDEDHILCLAKESATRESILHSLDWLRDHADSDDVVLFSFHGHGSCNGSYLRGKYGIVTAEGDMITREELDAKFDEISAGALCLIFNCCLSGNFVDTKTIRQDTSPEYFSKGLSHGLEDDNRVILMSTLKYGLGFGQTVDEVYFSRFIAEALGGLGDTNDDAVVSAEEAFVYAKEKFDPYALELLLSPIPQLFTFLNTGFFILAFPTLYDTYLGELPLATL